MKKLLPVCAAGSLALAGAFVTAVPAAGAAPPSYSVMLLHPLTTVAGGGSLAHGINNRSDVVGASVSGQSVRAVLWKARSGRPTELLAGSLVTEASDISGSGAIVGLRTPGPQSVDAFWQQGGSTDWVDLEDLEVRFEHISEGGVATLNADAAYLATSADELSELPPPAGWSYGRAGGIADNGRRVAGRAVNSFEHGSPDLPLMWTDGVPRALDRPSGAVAVTPNAVNDAGTSVGCAHLATGTTTAFRWSAEGRATQLPGRGACAMAVNNAGTIVGHANGTAAIWIDGTLNDLSSLVAQRSGYTLEAVTDINATGQVVGTARLGDGTARGFIATPTSAVNLYTTPGRHTYNGRQWNTNCAPYSQTVRCTTEIWATQVKVVGNRYVHVTGWTFNNLTYVASPRSLWANNPLGETGEWVSNDRRWRTDCDSRITGRGGCRSYIWSRIVTATPQGGGAYTYTSTGGWVFNNIVHFS